MKNSAEVFENEVDVRTCQFQIPEAENMKLNYM